jgi:hypothetical protein
MYIYYSFYPNISSINDIQGFAYAYKTNKDKIYVHNDWQEYSGYLKTPTVLKYDQSNNVMAWGYTALAERESQSVSDKKKKKRKEQNSETKVAERFKLHLCKIKDKPYLPDGLEYKTAIVDYLKEIGKVMKECLKLRCQDLDFFEQALIVMTVNFIFIY